MLYNVNPRDLNREIARELKERKLVTPPAWAPFVKTGSHAERVPTQPDWWYNRAAAVLRVVDVKGPIGTSKLAVKFGGRKNRGVAPDQFREAGTNILRKCLQQLEKSKLVKQVDFDGHKGRVLTKDGSALLKGAMQRCNPEEQQMRIREKPQKERAAAGAPRAPKKEGTQ